MQKFEDTGRWQEVNRMLSKVTQVDEEFIEHLSMLIRVNYLVDFASDYPDFTLAEFVANIFLNQLVNPHLSHEYKKGMQNVLLNLVALRKFEVKMRQESNNHKYADLSEEINKCGVSMEFIKDSNIKLVNDDENFASSEFDQFFTFECKGKRYYIIWLKEMVDKYNELLVNMPKEDKEELNKFIYQAKDIYYNLKFNNCDFEVSKIIEGFVSGIGQNQGYRNLDQKFWEKLNLADENFFENKDLSNVLSSIKQKILSHLYINVNNKDHFCNPYNMIPMFKNVNEIHNYMNEIRNVLKVLNGLSSKINENDLSNYQNLKIELQKYYFFFEQQYMSYFSFNEMPTKENIRTLKELLNASDYFKNELSESEQARLLDLVDTIYLPNVEKISDLINSSKDKQKTYREIIQMILVSDISIETMYKDNKFGFKSLKGVIYQGPESPDPVKIEPGSQKININKRLFNYLEDKTGQEYLKRMIFLPGNIDISTAVFNIGDRIVGSNDIKNVEILTDPNNYKTAESQQKLKELSEVINVAVDKFNSNNQVEVIKNVFAAFNSQYLMVKEKLENAKESSNKIKWWYLIFLRYRRKKRELLIQVDESTKKLENFGELISQTFNNLITLQNVYPEFNVWIGEKIKSKSFSENVYMLADIISSLTDIISSVKNDLSVTLNDLMEIIKKISILSGGPNQLFKLSDKNKLWLIEFVCEIAKNDPTGLLMKIVSEFLKLDLHGSTKESYIYRVIQSIYKFSQMCPNGVFPSSIYDLYVESDEKLINKIDKLHNEIVYELMFENTPLQILAKINSEEKQNQKISAR